MTGWTLRPPTTPGQYEYRQTPGDQVHVFSIVEVDGELMADFHNVWMSLQGMNGEWRRVLSLRQRNKLELKGRA